MSKNNFNYSIFNDNDSRYVIGLFGGISVSVFIIFLAIYIFSGDVGRSSSLGYVILGLMWLFSIPSIMYSKDTGMVWLFTYLPALSSLIFTGVSIIILNKYQILDTLSIFKTIFPYTLIASIVLNIIVFKKINKKTTNTSKFILTVSYFCSFTILTFAYIAFANGYLDKSAEKFYRVEVVGKYSSKYKGIYFKHWSKRNDFKSIIVKDEFYERVKEGDIIFIGIKEGNYGFEWVSGYKKDR